MSKIFFAHYLRLKWIASNQDQNDQRSILHMIMSNTFHQRKCLVFPDNLLLSGRTACRSGHLAIQPLVISININRLSVVCLSSVAEIKGLFFF